MTFPVAIGWFYVVFHALSTSLVPIEQRTTRIQRIGQHVAKVTVLGERIDSIYPLVNKHSYGTWPFIVDFPIENGDFV